MSWEEMIRALELEGIELWPAIEDVEIFCRPCVKPVGRAPISLITTISMVLEHVQSEGHREGRR